MVKLKVDSASSDQHAFSKTAKSGTGAKKKVHSGKVATAPKPQAHHAKLVQKQCNPRCEVGTLLDLVSASLRAQHSPDRKEAKHLLAADEEFGVTLDPLRLNIFGLRRARSISNKFDDLMVVIYQPAHMRSDNETLDGEDLPSANVKDAQDFIEAIKQNSTQSEFVAPDGWPMPGKDVGCETCRHWRMLAFPMTTDPGYEWDKKRKEHGFDDESKLADGIGQLMPGIYNNGYKLGLHLAGTEPPNSYPALQAQGYFPGRRRYPFGPVLDAAKQSYDAASPHKGKDGTYPLPPPDPAAPHKAARQTLEDWVTKILGLVAEKAGKGKESPVVEKYDLLMRIEGSDGRDRRNFEASGTPVTAIEVLELDPSNPAHKKADPDGIGVGVRISMSAAGGGAAESFLLEHGDVVVMRRADIAGTNIHTSKEHEPGAMEEGREVKNFSEGCQVFRSPTDFHVLLRLAQLYKRASCGSRCDTCRQPLTRSLVHDRMYDKAKEFISKYKSAKWTKKVEGALDEGLGKTWLPASEAAGKSAVPKATKKLHHELSAALLKHAKHVLRGTPIAAKRVADQSLPVAQQRLQVALGDSTKSPNEHVEDIAQQFGDVLTAQLEQAVIDVAESAVDDLLNRYQGDHFEPCDFDGCPVMFDYTIATLSESDLKSFVEEIEIDGRSWSGLFPEEA